MRPLITTPFGFRSTAAEVAAGVDLTGKRAIVTGASSGIGIETARALAGAGPQVALAVRNSKPVRRRRPTSRAELRKARTTRATTRPTRRCRS